MSSERNHSSKDSWPEDQEQRNRPGRFAWLRSRAAILTGVAIIAILLIAIGNGNSQASVDRNMAAVRQAKDLPAPMEYQFTGQGELTAGSAEAWVVGGVPILIGDQTLTEGKIHPGDSVSLVGHILENGSWAAERIVPISEEESFFSFAGPLEARSAESWQVAGVTLAVDDHSLLGEAIPIGELVLATFKVQPDNSWLALQIQALSVLEQLRTPTVTPIPTVTPTPQQPALEPKREPERKSPSPKKPPKRPPKPKKPPKHKGWLLEERQLANRDGLSTGFYDLNQQTLVQTNPLL